MGLLFCSEVSKRTTKRNKQKSRKVRVRIYLLRRGVVSGTTSGAAPVKVVFSVAGHICRHDIPPTRRKCHIAVSFKACESFLYRYL